MSNRFTLDYLQNPVAILQDLLQCPSVTPQEAGAQQLLAQWLAVLGFNVQHLPFGEVANLYASRMGAKAARHLLFAGHSDVVPPGELAAWQHPPFAGMLRDGRLYGRGAQDMKGAIACFIAALARCGTGLSSVSLAITGDEEGPALDGTVRLLQAVAQQGQKWDFALVGEPTCQQQLGDIVKIGRRGSLNAVLRAKGVAGHVAYPHLADNAAHRLAAALHKLLSWELDQGSANFQASNLEITQLTAGSAATNVVPGSACACFNIRFNDLWDLPRLKRKIEQILGQDELLEIEWLDGASESFLLAKPDLADLLRQAIKNITGCEARLDTSGGTSDARFIKNYCPVVEFGLVGDLMHKANESVPVAELEALTQIYSFLLQNV